MQQFELRQATPGDRDTLYRIKRGLWDNTWRR